MSTEIKYGWIRGGKKGQETRTAASQYFHRLGGHFVFLDGDGNVTLGTELTAASTVYGYAETGKDASGYNSWKSSTTAKADKVFVITDPTAVYAVPASLTAASVNASAIGRRCDIVVSGSTYTLKQMVNLAASTYKPLRVVDVDTDNDLAYVTIVNNY